MLLDYSLIASAIFFFFSHSEIIFSNLNTFETKSHELSKQEEDINKNIIITLSRLRVSY